MSVLGHTTITLTTGVVLYNYSHSLSAFLWLLITGIFIDLDHYIDYVREWGFSSDLKKVYNICKNGRLHFKKLTLFLHSYELLILLWLIVYLFNLNIAWKYAAIGIALHIFIDQITNPVFWPAYFLSFRALNNFETKKIFYIDKGVDYAYWNR